MAKKVKVTDFYGKVSEVESSKLRWRPSVYGFVIRADEILLLKQKNGYDLPGGGIELGETLEEAISREVKEETGIVVANPRLVDVTESFFVRVFTDDDYVHSLMIYYSCDYAGGELSKDGFDEGEQSYAEAPEWIKLEDIDKLPIGSSKDFRPILKRILANENHRD